VAHDHGPPFGDPAEGKLMVAEVPRHLTVVGVELLSLLQMAGDKQPRLAGSGS
jgi:hypothetical protein